MPHVVILYTSNLDAETDMRTLCRTLADAMLTVKDESGSQVFPTGGVRVLAYPAPHFAVADGKGEYGFVYVNLRMGRGRSDAVRKLAGETLSAATKAHFEPVLARCAVGVTLQIDEGQEVFNARQGSLHALFGRS